MEEKKEKRYSRTAWEKTTSPWEKRKGIQARTGRNERMKRANAEAKDRG